MTVAIGTRNLRVDLLKLLCAQSIVLHHFSAYGPLSDALLLVAPGFSALLFDYGRMAVQVFLVLGGFLAARSLDRAQLQQATPLIQVVARRYLRLIFPLLVALALITATAALTRPWLEDEFVPAPPGFLQVLAHVLLLQDLLGMEALSVGVWYVAIDFQLYVLLALIFWGRWLAPWRLFFVEAVVMSLMLASLLHFNRDPQFDRWALYFIGAYGMGVVASWAQRSPHRAAILLGLCVVVTMALALEFRERLVLALVTALLLGTMSARLPATGLAKPQWVHRIAGLLGQSSYGLFLVHFAVLLLINVCFLKWNMQGLGAILSMMALGCLASSVLGVAFARYVEMPLSNWVDRR